MQVFECWVIRLRNEEGTIADTAAEIGAFNTLKFSSFSAALAHCRRRSYSPIDYVICRARFTAPEILETREIDYGQSSLALAGGNPEERE